jgi:hypothetical protein
VDPDSRPVTRELGKVPVRKLEARQIERFLRGMAAEGLSTSTIQRVRRVLVRALDRAIRDRLVAVNVARVAEVPEGTRRRSRSMTGAQARAGCWPPTSIPGGVPTSCWRCTAACGRVS